MLRLEFLGFTVVAFSAPRQMALRWQPQTLEHTFREPYSWGRLKMMSIVMRFYGDQQLMAGHFMAAVMDTTMRTRGAW
jgi:hypothetical protein